MIDELDILLMSVEYTLMQILINRNGVVELYENWLQENFATELFINLLNTLNWQEDEIIIFGKKIKCPRLTAFYGDKNIHYRYSGANHITRVWTKDLLDIKNKLFIECGLEF